MRRAVITIDGKLVFGPAPYSEAVPHYRALTTGGALAELAELVPLHRKKLSPIQATAETQPKVSKPTKR